MKSFHRFWSVALEICPFIRESTSIKSDTDNGVESVLHFIPTLISGVEIRASCRPLDFFHTNLGKLYTVWAKRKVTAHKDILDNCISNFEQSEELLHMDVNVQ